MFKEATVGDINQKNINKTTNQKDDQGTEDVELHGNVNQASTEPSSIEDSDDDVLAHMNVSTGKSTLGA